MRRRAAFIGVTGTIFAHLAAVLALPAQFADPDRERARPVEVVWEMLPQEELERQEPDEFVMTNPDVPSNEPDETNRFSDRDQQAAQEERTELSPDNEPHIEGEDIESQSIVSGTLEPPVPQQPSAPESDPSQESPDPSQMEVFMPPPLMDRRPPPGFETPEPEDEEGPRIADSEEELEDPTDDRRRVVGIDISEELDDAEEVEEEQRETAPTDLQQDPSQQPAQQPSPDSRPQPQPRPRLPQTVTAPIQQRDGGVANIGAVAIDARFSEYGDYLQRMFEAIQYEWHGLIRSRIRSAEREGVVVVEYTLDRTGRVVRSRVIDSSSGMVSTIITKQAIDNRSPFEPWTREMIEVLGDQQTITVRFLYR